MNRFVKIRGKINIRHDELTSKYFEADATKSSSIFHYSSFIQIEQKMCVHYVAKTNKQYLKRRECMCKRKQTPDFYCQTAQQCVDTNFNSMDKTCNV